MRRPAVLLPVVCESRSMTAICSGLRRSASCRSASRTTAERLASTRLRRPADRTRSRKSSAASSSWTLRAIVPLGGGAAAFGGAGAAGLVASAAGAVSSDVGAAFSVAGAGRSGAGCAGFGRMRRPTGVGCPTRLLRPPRSLLIAIVLYELGKCVKLLNDWL